MKKFTVTLLLLCSSSLFTLTSYASQMDIEQIEDANSSLDLKQLEYLTSTLQDYERAFAYYRLALSAHYTGASTMAKNAIDKATVELERLNNTGENTVEVKSLLALTYALVWHCRQRKLLVLGLNHGLCYTR